MTNYKQSQLYVLCTIFFFWGFVAASNGVFIPFCKSHFELSQFQSQLIEFVFYGAYFIGSLLIWILSQFLGFDFLNKIGYKNGMIYGLIISIFGALCIIPAVQIGTFELILVSFFIVAFGFSIQQSTVYPFLVALGTSETSSHRINLAASFNSIGTTLGPLVVSILLFGSINNSFNNSTSISSITTLYVLLALLLSAAVALLWFSNLPDIKNKEPFERGLGAFKHPQLVWSMIAIFVYVGVEVTIQSNMGELLKNKNFGGFDTPQISSFISLYWGSLMMGRLAGAISVFNFSKFYKNLFVFLAPFIGFGIVLMVNLIKGNDVSQFYIYALVLPFFSLGIWYGNEKPFKTLLIFSLLGVLAMLIGVLNVGNIALYALISGGLCCSIMWSCIFPAGLAGLGKYTNQASTFMIMMILGGAIIPPLQGLFADKIGIHFSYILPLLGFLFLFIFSIKVKDILLKKGIDFDK
ncbi:MAG: MFS transporter [Cytophagales bacterium]|nr:MAG: MFS transporter [Cytophagales bacterium]